ncbi:hypothetical protein AQJ46_50230 [Streptomyces canus]|uniref:Uncharacterized protein n=1 Tax=Streptomyces canus TaxID=58343 RepID=A0A101RJU9_9ACTN|nr:MULTISPECIES: hypothetical protein [Streptomyces]KUN53465.1 hypothetical protein AQJ46_50230 [Streptomyces canus]MDI5912706.1 hypothetical protein [Streptomyces sp. 12257]
MRRNTFLAAATATALSASLFTGLSPAHADGAAGGPVLSDADGWYQPGKLFVTAHSDSPITRITAHLYPLDAPDGTPEAGSTEDFTQYSGQDARSGTWRAPVHLAQLGDYRVTVDLQDASGAAVTGALSPHILQYRTIVTISDLTATPSAPDYLHQNVSVSGTVEVADPRLPDTPASAEGIPVAVNTGRSQVSATAIAGGRFTTAFVPTEPSFQLSAAPQASATYPGAIDLLTARQYLHTTQAPVRFSASTHALNLKQGATGTITGHAEIQTASGWQPLPHTDITLRGLDAHGNADFVAGETTTGSQGAYTLHVSSENPAPSAELVVGTDYMPFQQVATQPFSLHVAYTTHLGMSASLNDDASLHVSGYVYYEDPRAKWPAKPTVTLQYSKDGKSGWRDATTIPVPVRYNKPLFDETFARTLTTRNTDAWWRARFNGNPDLGTSTTKPVHLYRYATRITGFRAHPDPVRKSQPISFGGTLQYKKGTTWKPLSGGSPTLYFKPRGSTTYHYVCELGSDKHGHLIGMVTAEKDGTWAIALSRETGDHYLRSARVTDYVDVR